MKTKKIVKRKPREKKENLPAVIEKKDLSLNPQNLLSKALEEKVGIDTIERLLDMRDRLKAEEAESAFRSAMSSFQSECPIIKKDKAVKNKADKGGGERYRYAPLDSIVRQVQTYLRRFDLSYQIETTMENNAVTTTVTACHIMGHKEKTSFSVPIQVDAYMSEPQKWASAATYSKRYAFCNAFGILTGDEDNDANIIIEPPQAERTPEELDEIFKRGSDLVESSQTLEQFIERGSEIINIGKSLPDNMRKKLSADYLRRKKELEGKK